MSISSDSDIWSCIRNLLSYLFCLFFCRHQLFPIVVILQNEFAREFPCIVYVVARFVTMKTFSFAKFCMATDDASQRCVLSSSEVHLILEGRSVGIHDRADVKSRHMSLFSASDAAYPMGWLFGVKELLVDRACVWVYFSLVSTIHRKSKHLLKKFKIQYVTLVRYCRFKLWSWAHSKNLKGRVIDAVSWLGQYFRRLAARLVSAKSETNFFSCWASNICGYNSRVLLSKSPRNSNISHLSSNTNSEVLRDFGSLRKLLCCWLPYMTWYLLPVFCMVVNPGSRIPQKKFSFSLWNIKKYLIALQLSLP